MRRTLCLFVAVLSAAAFFLFFRLGDRAFRNPDEGRYAEVAREILRSGDWVKPTLYGVGYLRKPILFYWLIAGSFAMFGENEWAARLVPAFASLCVLGAVFWFCLRFFGRKTSLFACAILATNLFYLQVGRYIIIDAVFTLFVLGCLFSYYSGLHSEKNKDAWFGCFYVSLALAFLAKGLIALAIPALSIGAYLALTGRIQNTLRRMQMHLGIPIFLFVAGPWYFLMEKREPGFIKFFFGHEHWRRFISSDFEHQEPWYYYLILLPLVFLPWVLFWRPVRQAFARTKADPSGDPVLFLQSAVVANLLFFSLSRSKMATYILPCLPLGAILLAHGWVRWLESRPVFTRAEKGVLALLVIFAIGIMVLPARILANNSYGFPEALLTSLRVLGGGLLTGAVVCWRSIRRGRPERFFYSLAATMGVVSLLFTFPMEVINRQYSTKAFALYLKDEVSAGEQIYIYDHPGPFYDFAFYLNRNVKLVGLEGELEYSRQDARAGEVSVSREAFLDLLKRQERLYCLIRRSDFEDLERNVGLKLEVLMEDPRKVLFLSGRL